MPAPYTDGTFTSPKQNGPKRVSYPFLNNPVKDTTTVMTERDYYVLPANYTPAAALSTDPDSNVSYLVEETPPVVERGVYKFTRTYCNIPGNQVKPTSRIFVRPSMNGVTVNGFYAVSFDGDETSSIFSSVQNITAVGLPLSTGLRSFVCNLHGGALGDQVALYNGTKVVAQTTVQLITNTDVFSVLSNEVSTANNLSVTGCVFAKNAFRVVNGPKDCSVRTTERYYLPGITAGVNSASDIPGVPIYADPLGWLGRITATTFPNSNISTVTDRYTVASHGMATGDSFFILNVGTGGSPVAGMTQYYAIKYDTNEFYVANSPANAFANAYLNITTNGTDHTLVVADPWPEIATSDLQQWMGPYLMKATDEVQMSDALEGRAVTA